MNRDGGLRAGILVTGTEVLSGYVTDRNGPWLSERLAELGVEVEEITVVGDRPEDLEGALRHMRDQGLDLIVTSGGLGPTADDLTAEVVGRFAGREARPRRGDGGEDRRRSSPATRAACASTPRPCARQTASRRWCPRGRPRSTRPARRPGLVVPADGQVVIVLPGPAARAAGRCGRARWRRRRRRRCSAAREPYTTMSIRMFGIPESELAKALREIEDEGVALDELEVTTCLRRRRARHRRAPPRRAAEEAAEALRAGLAERLGRFTYTESGEIDRGGRLPAARGPNDRGRRVVTAAGLLAGRLTLRPGSSQWFAGGVVSYSNEAKAEAARGRSEADREQRRGLARGRRGDGRRRPRALRRRRRLSRSRESQVPTAAARRSRSATSASAPRRPRGRGSPATRCCPAVRTDVRERSVVVALHLVRYLLEGREPPR